MFFFLFLMTRHLPRSTRTDPLFPCTTLFCSVPGRAGVCGKPRDGFTLRLVDENDLEVPTGAVGELVLRGDAPWAMNHGYYKDPEATARAWRNGWFHTGDSFRRDANGDYWFVDRTKDAIRRRGENISSFEVELVVNADRTSTRLNSS